MAAAAYPDRAAIEAGQLEQLRSLIAELFPANAFYTRKLQAQGLTFDVASLADFSARFPFTTKDELVADHLAHPPYGSNLTYPLAQYTRFHQTSGTSGKPLRWLDTHESWDAMVECWMEIFSAAGVNAHDRVLFPFSFGPFLGFWLAFEAATRIGCLCLAAGSLSSAARLRLLLDNQATAFCCTPAYAMRLAEVAAEEKLDLTKTAVRRILVAGEPGGSIPSTRARIESLWPGARVFDHHGMTEVGPVTYECPTRPGVLHVMENAFYPEVINPRTGLAVPSEQEGELVLSTLSRVGSPLLRYRTGDLVKTGPPVTCACGRHTLTLVGGILGRSDDMVIVRGVNVYPAGVEEIILGCGNIAEYRVRVGEVNGLMEMQVEIEPAPGGADASRLAARVAREFETSLALRVPVKAVNPGTLPRFEMKAQRWVRD